MPEAAAYLTTLYQFERVIRAVMAYETNGLSGSLQTSCFFQCDDDQERYRLAP
jgi:hypothetical protein